SKGNYIIEKGKTYGPDKPIWMYKAPDSLSFWSSFISGAQRMSNGNTFINEGARGRFFEVTKEGKMVWEYLNPYRGDVRKVNGYIIFAVPNSPYVYLLNRRGEVVHEWKSSYGAFNAYLQNDGSLMLGEFDPDFPTFGFGGPYGRLQKISWDNKILWDFELANDTEIIHHDFNVMPNGHILAIAYEAKSYNEAIAMGRMPDKTPKDGPWLEKIIEIVPEGK